MRGYFGLGQLSAAEKSDILKQHTSVYNGYQTMQPKVSNTHPLTVYDFAGDKEGMVVNNKGEVKKYTNMGINESAESKEVCDECGSMIMDGVCECNYGHMEESELHEDVCECGGKIYEGACNECNYGHIDEESGHLDDIYDVKDLNLKDGEFDYVEGGGNDYGTFEKAHHMKNIKNEQVEDDDDFMNYEPSYTEDGVDDTDNEDDGFEDLQTGDGEMYEIDVKDLIKGKKYKYKTPSYDDDIEFSGEHEYPGSGSMYGFRKGNTGYALGKKSVEDFISHLEDDDDFPELDEQGYTGGGNAPDMDLSNIEPGYDFKSDGPEQFQKSFDDLEVEGPDAFQKSFDDLEVEDSDEDAEAPAYDFESGGPNDVYPVFEDDMYSYEPEKMYETMESAWADEELDEQTDISGVQGVYGDMDKAYQFNSDGPGKGGPYQEFSYESELDEDMSMDDHISWDINDVDCNGTDYNGGSMRIKTDDEGNPLVVIRFCKGDKERLEHLKTKARHELKSRYKSPSHGEEEFEEVDEDLMESFIQQKNKINEMFNRMNRYN